MKKLLAAVLLTLGLGVAANSSPVEAAPYCVSGISNTTDNQWVKCSAMRSGQKVRAHAQCRRSNNTYYHVYGPYVGNNIYSRAYCAGIYGSSTVKVVWGHYQFIG